jgi:hypothetical protein
MALSLFRCSEYYGQIHVIHNVEEPMYIYIMNVSSLDSCFIPFGLESGINSCYGHPILVPNNTPAEALLGTFFNSVKTQVRYEFHMTATVLVMQTVTVLSDCK